MCNGFFRFTSCATLVALLVAKPFLIHVLAHVQALVGHKSGIEHAAASQRVTRSSLIFIATRYEQHSEYLKTKPFRNRDRFRFELANLYAMYYLNMWTRDLRSTVTAAVNYRFVNYTVNWRKHAIIG